MTVCIAAIYDGNCILGAADRMLTSGDIQFQPEQSKIYTYTTSIVAMISGDVSLHAEIYLKVWAEVNRRLSIDKSRWFPVENVVSEYEKTYSAIRRARAERDLLSPLGLTTDTFIARQSQMQPDLVSKLAQEMLNYSMPDTSVIIAGIDESGCHLYTGQDGKFSCEDAVGFSAIGAGHWHAQSQFMFARYARNASAAKALYLVYSAKKRAETAPGVGSETDMFIVGPRPGTYSSVKDSVVRDVAKIYSENLRASKRVYERTEKRVNEYIEKLAPPATSAEEQKTFAPTPDGATPADGTEGNAPPASPPE